MLTKNLSEEQKKHKNIISFVENMESELFSLLKGTRWVTAEDDGKIRQQLKDIAFSMETPGATRAKIDMLDGKISAK